MTIANQLNFDASSTPKRNLLYETLEQRTLLAASVLAFAPHVDFLAGTAPVALVAGDFNGDGNQDLAVADSRTRKVNVFFGNGKGGFSAGPALSLSGIPSAIVTGDFNSDGRTDLAVACSPLTGQGASTVTTFLNTGSGSFGLGQITNVMTGVAPGDTISLAAGDFNKDGILDLGVADYNTQSISILTGTGTGAFAAPQTYLTNSHPTAIAAGDFNDDGRLDLAVTTSAITNSSVKSTGTISLWLGGANGSFKSGGNVATYNRAVPLSLTTANLTGAKTPGLIAGNSDATVTVLTNNGGRFSHAATAFVAAPASSITTGDFNLDGHADIVTAGSGSSAGVGASVASIVLGARGGRISRTVAVSTGARPADIVIADFNNDGKPDIATANPTTGTVSILINTSKIKVPLVSTRTVLTASAGSAPAGSNLTMTATVIGSKASSLPNAKYPTGTVAFYDGSTLIGVVPVAASSNQAIFSTNSLSVGAHSLQAIYRGDGAFAGSTSARISTIITPTAASGPRMTGVFASSSFGRWIAPGQTGTVSIRVSNQGNTTAVGTLVNKLYLSADGVVDAGDILLGVRGALARTSIRLSPGQSVLLNGTVTVPARTPLGSYSLLTALNSGGSILQYMPSGVVASPAQYTVSHVFGTLGINQHLGLLVRDMAGNIGTFRLYGPGVGAVNIGTAGIDLAISGTTASSTLTISVRGARFQLNTLSDAAAIANIFAAGVAVRHTVSLAGGAANVYLGSFGNGATDSVTLGSGAHSTIVIGRTVIGTLNAASAVSS